MWRWQNHVRFDKTTHNNSHSPSKKSLRLDKKCKRKKNMYWEYLGQILLEHDFQLDSVLTELFCAFIVCDVWCISFMKKRNLKWLFYFAKCNMKYSNIDIIMVAHHSFKNAYRNHGPDLLLILEDKHRMAFLCSRLPNKLGIER